MQRHLISHTTAPGTNLAALLGQAIIALGRFRVPASLPARLQRDVGLIDEIPPQDRDPAAREAAAMQLLRSI